MFLYIEWKIQRFTILKIDHYSFFTHFTSRIPYVYPTYNCVILRLTYCNFDYSRGAVHTTTTINLPASLHATCKTFLLGHVPRLKVISLANGLTTCTYREGTDDVRTSSSTIFTLVRFLLIKYVNAISIYINDDGFNAFY